MTGKTRMPRQGSDGRRQRDPRPGAEGSGHDLHLGAVGLASDCRDHDLGPDRSDRRMTQRIRRCQCIGVGGPNRTAGNSVKGTTRSSSHDLRLGHEGGARTRLGRSTVPRSGKRGERGKGERFEQDGLKNLPSPEVMLT